MNDSVYKKQVGRYTILEELGRGAIGVVYLAQDPLIHRPVAIKLLHATHSLSNDKLAIMHERFLREAQTAGSLDHANIVRILDVGQDEESGHLYIVMEHVSGSSLDKLIERGSPDLATVLHVVGQIASGLDAAHAREIVHRDVKPANVMVTESGIAKITDFGIARIAESNLTRDARELGTPVYMSPEQVSGKALDGRADLFSLGVLCYQLLADRPPFWGTDALSIADEILHATPAPLSSVVPDLPPAIDAVMDRILAKDPEARYATGREFHAALVACFAPESDPTPDSSPAARTGHGRAVVWACAALSLAILAFFAFRYGVATRATSRGGPSVEVTSNPSSPNPLVLVAPAPIGKPAPVSIAKAPRALAVVPKAASMTISLGHWIAHGVLTVALDGAVILSEDFDKKKLAAFQTTRWPSIPISSGHHELSATMEARKGKIYRSAPRAIDLTPGTNLPLHVSVKNGALALK